MFVYILTNTRHTVFYTGVTNDLVKRVWQHKQKLVKGFTSRYNIDKLVYFESWSTPIEAIEREKQLKDYRRSKKLELIELINRNWRDLYNDICS